RRHFAAEISGQFLGGWIDGEGIARFRVTPAFIGGVKEHFVSDDWSANGSPEFMLRIAKRRHWSVRKYRAALRGRNRPRGNFIRELAGQSSALCGIAESGKWVSSIENLAPGILPG